MKMYRLRDFHQGEQEAFQQQGVLRLGGLRQQPGVQREG